MASLTLKQIKTLVYRNYLLTKRKKGQTAQMILFPIYFVVLLVVLKISAYRPTSYSRLNNTEEFNFNAFAQNFTGLNNIYIAPNFSEVNSFVSALRNIPLLQNSNITIFPDQSSMDSAYKTASQINPVGILFQNSTIHSYALRFPYLNLPGSSPIDRSLSNCRSGFLQYPCPSNQYLTSGFSALQFIVDTALTQMDNPSYQLPNIMLQKMPKPGGIFNAEAFTIASSIYLVFAMSPFMIILLVNVVAEKQEKIKEAMKVMGLSSFALWSAWSITYGVILIVMVLVMSLIAVYGTLFSNSDFFLIFLLFLLYGFSVEMMGFMLTPFFINARTAGTAGGFLNFILGMLYLVVAFVPNISVSVIWALNLFAPTGFAIAISQIALMEVSGVGASFSNLWVGPFPVGITLVMLAVDTVLYFLLTLYFDHIIPGEYGRRQPFYFPLQPSFWFPSSQETKPPSLEQPKYSEEDFEVIPDDLVNKDAIKFCGITKTYKSGNIFSNSTTTTAVNNFSLDIYEGQITALLGHNGAGKTTLFNILTGFIDSTSGLATVFNLNIANAKDLEKIRQMTGFCPQHNILFDVLSVKEHLIIFAGIKGIPDDLVDQEVERILGLIGLQNQANTHAKKLSGGQKRKLSVGIAIMGDPKILILDEPTAGMDPYSRHTLWDLLRQRKEGRVTLLTTHFMDEADILADRKAIISRGKLRCVGSSLFLKNRFGIGYHLGVVTKSTGDHTKLHNYVKHQIEGSQLQRSSGYENGYTLPITQVDKFAGLFDGLEVKGEELDIQSFGVSMTTLEEVFLKIGEDDEVEEDTGEHQSHALTTSNNYIIQRLRSSSNAHVNDNFNMVETLDSESVEVTMNGKVKFNPSIGKVGQPSNSQIFFAYLRILMLNNLRNPGFIIFGFFLPLGLAIGGAAVLNISTSSENTDDPPLISVTGSPSTSYGSLLYKNSSGSSLNDFISNSPIPVVMSDLTNLLPSPSPHFYLASNVSQFERNQISYQALYNTSGVHSLPTIFNSMSQSALRFITNSTSNFILTFNKRWPAITDIQSFNGGIFGGVLMSAFSVIMTTVSPAIFPVYEREKKVRSQLRVSGMSFKLYWGAHFFIDYIWFLIIALGFFIGVTAFKVDELTTSGAIIAMVFLFIGSGASSVMTSYCASFMFDKVDTVSSIYFNLVQLVTLLPYITVSLLDQLNSETAAIALNVTFAILIPYYTPFSGLYYISKVYTKRLLTGQAVSIPTAIYFDWSEPMVPFSIIVAFLHVPIVYFLLRIIDIRASGGNIKNAFTSKTKVNSAYDLSLMSRNEAFDEDDDVKEERSKVNEIVSSRDLGEPVVLMQNLRKEFVKDDSGNMCKRKKPDEKTKVAVANLSLSVHRGEVLGLLGPNGAGKTTAISTITADVGPTRGQVYVSGHNIQSNVSEAFQEMGYCSQDNPLWEEITLKEHLEIFAVAHGVNKKMIKKTIDNYVDALDIREHLNKRSKQLSGGTKRKLCFAMAMLGNPQVVLLDEPSTGMDPKTKRFMWDTISTAFEGSQRGAILTTHYMEEADALCSRVGIMVLGQLRCIGSTQHLKSKFGQGYVLEIKMKEIQRGGNDSLYEFIRKLFDNVADPEVFSHRHVYKVAQKNVTSLAKVFGSLEEAKDQLGIEEYSFSQSTLEQVFLQFAKEQDEREAEELA